MNKFERTRILSVRGLELANGVKPKVEINGKNLLNGDYIKIAEQELNEGKLDLELYRN